MKVPVLRSDIAPCSGSMLTYMKTHFLLAACLILVGCDRQEANNREVLSRLDAIKGELASSRSATVRWAFANKREIESAIFQWSHNRMEEIKGSEGLSFETEEKIRQYEALQNELMHKRMEAMRMRLPPRANPMEVSMPDKDYEALSNQVAQAKAPIADILDRRNRQATQYREQFSVDKLVAEYAKDRFDLIVDSSDEGFSRSAVLYRTSGDALDITDGVIQLFRKKAKP